MLRITTSPTPPQPSRTLHLEGQLIDRWVSELETSCADALSDDGRVILDLAGVSFIDLQGLVLLRTLCDRNVALVNASPFVTHLLKGVGL